MGHGVMAMKCAKGAAGSESSPESGGAGIFAGMESEILKFDKYG